MENKSQKVWSDHETDVDLVGFSHLVRSITDVVHSPHLLPATIGVFGDWGSGKSSLLNMVRKKLEEDKKTLVLNFNGWLFEGYDDAKAALMETIVDELEKRCKLSEKAKKLALRLLRRINWFRVAGGIAGGVAGLTSGGIAGLVGGLSAADVINRIKQSTDELSPEDLQKAFAAEKAGSIQTVREFRSDFGSLLAETDLERLVVIIDDLDRCLPDTIIETLEAIKLFLFVERTAFIIGADERLINYAVRTRFPELPGERSEVGRDYLEKLVQFPIRVPQLSTTEIESLIGLLFVEVCTDEIKLASTWVDEANTSLGGTAFTIDVARERLGDIPDELEVGFTLASRVSRILGQGLNGNPRQCKRFLNTLMLRLQMAQFRKQDLSAQVLAKLMLLEYFRPESFRLLAVLQISQHGKPHELKVLEDFEITEGDAHEAGKNDGDATSTKPDESFGKLSPSIQAWRDDSFVREWLSLEPKLSDHDLGPYFYFSRDNLEVASASVTRLSARAQEQLNKILNASEAVLAKAIKESTNLNAADAAAIFEELSARARNHEDLSAVSSPLTRLFEFVGVRMELVSQLIVLLDQLPEPMVPVAIPPRLRKLAIGSESEATATKLIERWSNSTANAPLQIAAKSLTKNSKA